MATKVHTDTLTWDMRVLTRLNVPDDTHWQRLHERTELTHELWQLPPLDEGGSELEGDAEEGEDDVGEGEVGDIEVCDCLHPPWYENHVHDQGVTNDGNQGNENVTNGQKDNDRAGHLISGRLRFYLSILSSDLEERLEGETDQVPLSRGVQAKLRARTAEGCSGNSEGLKLNGRLDGFQ